MLAQPPACIAFAGQQCVCKAGGFTKGVAALQQANNCIGVQVATAVDVAVLARYYLGQLAAFHGYAVAVAHGVQQFDAALFVANVAGQRVGMRRTFTQIVHQAGKAHGQRCTVLRGHVQHHHQVYAGVNLGVVRFGLGHAPQAVDFGQQHWQRPAVTQHVEHARRLSLHQPTRQFLPHALCHQGVYLASSHHAAHECHRFWRNAKVSKPGCKARQSQDAHGVFGKGQADVAQHFTLQVSLAVVGVYQFILR